MSIQIIPLSGAVGAEIKGVDVSTNVPDQAKRLAAITEKMPNTFHSATKKAIAPLAIWFDNVTIFSSPASCFETQLDLINITIKPRTPKKTAKDLAKMADPRFL